MYYVTIVKMNKLSEFQNFIIKVNTVADMVKHSDLIDEFDEHIPMGIQIMDYCERKRLTLDDLLANLKNNETGNN
jgi:hypothetical protein